MNINYNKIDNIDKLKIGDHTLLLYESEPEMISSSVSFIRTSLKRGVIKSAAGKL